MMLARARVPLKFSAVQVFFFQRFPIRRIKTLKKNSYKKKQHDIFDGSVRIHRLTFSSKACYFYYLGDTESMHQSKIIYQLIRLCGEAVSGSEQLPAITVQTCIDSQSALFYLSSELSFSRRFQPSFRYQPYSFVIMAYRQNAQRSSCALCKYSNVVGCNYIKM